MLDKIKAWQVKVKFEKSFIMDTLEPDGPI